MLLYIFYSEFHKLNLNAFLEQIFKEFIFIIFRARQNCAEDNLTVLAN
jgi:hypothetical protein